MSKAKKAVNLRDQTRDLTGYDGAALRANLKEPSLASASPEREDRITMDTSKLLEKVVDRNSLNLAYKRVKRNGGSHGVDGMKVEIRKPDGGVRMLGVPTVVDAKSIKRLKDGAWQPGSTDSTRLSEDGSITFPWPILECFA